MRNCIVGIDIGGTRTKYGLVDTEKGEVLKTVVESTEKKDAHAFIKQVTDIVNWFKTFASVTDGYVTGVGFGVPGFVNEHGMVETTYGFLEFMEKYPMKDIIERELSLPCRLDNDARVVSLGEALYGKGKKYNRVLTLTLGTGVGFGFVVNKTFANALPIEHMGGHISVTQQGVTCYCGKTGCLEALVSSTGIVGQLEKVKTWDGEVSAEAVFTAASEGHVEARQIVNRVTAYLGAGIYNYVNILAPDIVVLGGGIAKGLAPFIETIKKVDYLTPYQGYHFELAVSELEELAGMLGSAALFNASK